MTTITQESAGRRFHQGAYYLMGLVAKSDRLDPQEVIGVASIMAYVGTYAYPDKNLFEFRQVMTLALEFLKPNMDLEMVVNRATENAEVFRRPWTEEPPRDPQARTI
jgi:hypothetical protein